MPRERVRIPDRWHQNPFVKDAMLPATAPLRRQGRPLQNARDPVPTASQYVIYPATAAATSGIRSVSAELPYTVPGCHRRLRPSIAARLSSRVGLAAQPTGASAPTRAVLGR